MKRILIYIVLTAALLAIPLERTDVADLRPVQTVALYKTQNGYLIKTDTDDSGAGVTVKEAYGDLIRTTPGFIYLDTADFFLIDTDIVNSVEDMRIYLKNGVQICATVGQGDLKAVSRYLSVQRGLKPLKKWEKGQYLPVLDCRKDRLKFM